MREWSPDYIQLLEGRYDAAETDASRVMLLAAGTAMALLAHEIVPLPIRHRNQGSERLDFRQFDNRMLQRYFLFDNIDDLMTVAFYVMPETEWGALRGVPSCSGLEALAILLVHLRLGYTIEHVLDLICLAWSRSKYIKTYNAAAAFLHRKFGSKSRFDAGIISNVQCMRAHESLCRCYRDEVRSGS